MPVSYSGVPGKKVAGGRYAAYQPRSFVSFPASPTSSGATATAARWQYFRGLLAIAGENHFDPDGVDFRISYANLDTMPAKPRLLVTMHPSGGAVSFVENSFSPDIGAAVRTCHAELRTQDGQVKGPGNTEWWASGKDGLNYGGRRIAAGIEHLLTIIPTLDVMDRGIVLQGQSMGGAGCVCQAMILPDPWRERVAYSRGTIGIMMPRRVNQLNPGQYSAWPPDNGTNPVWDSVDFSIQAATDPIVRGMHFRHAFSSDDYFSEGPDGSTQLEWVNLCEQHKISCAAAWVKNLHTYTEPGVNLPSINYFSPASEIDVTLDRAHPCITNSTGNYPLTQAQRVDEVNYPRGHYNMGVLWKHADIVDSVSEIVFPLRYTARTAIGGGIPDQPASITVSVTPRRPRNFKIISGETLNWIWDNGALSGTVVVMGDTATIDGIPLESGGTYKNLRIYK